MKKGVILLIGVFLYLNILGIVLAQPSSSGFSGIAENVDNAINTFISATQPITAALIGPSPQGEFFFAKILFLFIMIAVLFATLKRIDLLNENPWVLWTITIAVSILGVRYLSDVTWIKTMLLPYETLYVAISAGIPFACYFIIVNVGFKDQPSFIRKAAWIFFGVIFVFLWFTRYDMGDATFVYPVTAVLCLGMVFLDGTMNRYFNKIKIDKAMMRSRKESIYILQDKLAKFDERLAHGRISITDYKRDTKEIRDLIKELQKQNTK
ncbi:MAG: hypothetical protein Q8N99_02535 [Nanoarchaeota archaeon]|nr:hypothetical protein [Nanoarchaeota archaeon]